MVNGCTMNNDVVRTKHLIINYSDVTLSVGITKELDLVNSVASLKLMFYPIVQCLVKDEVSVLFYRLFPYRSKII